MPDLPAVRAHRTRPLRSDAARNRELVVEAALHVFSRFGTLGTVDQVAEHAGVGRATVYRSFPTRDALMNAVGIGQLAEVRQMATDCLENAKKPGAGLIRYTYELFAYNQVNRLYLELFRGVLEPEVVAARDATRIANNALLEDARRARLIRPDVVDQDFNRLTGGLAVQLTLDPATTDEDWKRAPGLVLSALGVPHGLAVRKP